jgi:hypothetical protein
MGAFFSGTDDNNDKSGIYYSAVIGKLTETNFEYVIRFNLYEQKKKCTLDEVFDIQQKRVEVPEQWLAQVDNSRSMPVIPDGKMGKSNRWGRYGHMGISSESLWDQRGMAGDGYSAKLEKDIAYLQAAADEARGKGQGGVKDQTKKESHRAGNVDPSFVSGPLDEMNEELLYRQEDNDSPGFDLDDLLGLEEKYGADAFEAYGMIDDFLVNLEEADEALMDIIQQCYAMMTTEGQLGLAEKGMR